MRINGLVILSVLISLMNVGCMYAIRYDGPYKGKVIDSDTGEPIEGAVVLGTWYTVTSTPGGGVSRYHDARETVTDKDGDFEVEGMGLRVMSTLAPMDVVIFKAGYEHLSAPWMSLKESDYLIRKMNIKWEGRRAIIPLRRLTMEARRKHGPPSRPSIPIGKMKLLTREINKERIELGLTPFELGGNNR